MRRDSLPSSPARRVADQSSDRFIYLAEVIARHFEPTETELQTLSRAYESIGGFVLESLEFKDLAVEVHGQGSRQLGTIVRPLHLREVGLDVDAVTRLGSNAWKQYGGTTGPSELISDMHKVLKRYADQHGLDVDRFDRCVTLKYADGMTVDVAPVIDDPLHAVPQGATHVRIPDRTLRSFEPTNPKGLEQAFNEAAKVQAVYTRTLDSIAFMEKSLRSELAPLPEADQVLGRLLCRLVQLLKIHRNATFGAPVDGQEDITPSSVFITALAAQAYALKAPQPHSSQLDLLLDILRVLPLCFEREQRPDGTQYWTLANPWAPGDNLAASMNTAGRQQAFDLWHSKVTTDVSALVDSIEAQRGSDEIQKLLEKSFGPRAAKALRDSQAPKASGGTSHRKVIASTTAGSLMSFSARANTNFGSAA